LVVAGFRFLGRALNRVAIWGVGVAVAALPAMAESDIHWNDPMDGMMQQINTSGSFKDLYFLVITVAIVAVTNLIDNCLRRLQDVHVFLRPFVIPVVLGYVVILIYGTTTFLQLAKVHGPIVDAQLLGDAAALKVILVSTLLTEIFIAATLTGEP
jgi:hypothetical protein